MDLKTKALLAVMLVIGIVVGFVLGYVIVPSNISPNPVEVSSPVENLIFTRTGVAVILGDETAISSIEVFDTSDSRLCSQKIDGMVDTPILLDFIWKPTEKYKIETTAQDGTLTSVYGYAPSKPSPLTLTAKELGDLPPGDNVYTTGHWMGNPPGDVRTSPNGKYAMVMSRPNLPEYQMGWKNDTVLLFEVETQNELWTHLVNASFYAEFSGDSQQVVIGTNTKNALLYCLDVETGDEVWRYEAGYDVGLGKGGSPRGWPSVRPRFANSNNRVYCSAEYTWTERWEEAGKTLQHTCFNATIYCFEASTGSLLWRIPNNASQIMDYALSGITGTPDGSYVLVSTGTHASDRTHNDGTVFCLDGSTGDELWRYSIPIAMQHPMLDHVSIGGLSVSSDGNYVLFNSIEGRAYMLDNKKMVQTKGGNGLLWQQNMSLPLVINDVLMRSSASEAYTNGKVAVFSSYTFFSYNVSATAPPPNPDAPAEHPYHSYLHVFDVPTGDLLWRYRFEGYATPDGLVASADGKYVAVAVRQTVIPDHFQSSVPRTTDTHGVFVFNLDREGSLTEKLEWFYHTEGPVEHVAFTPNGKYVVIVELPLDSNQDPHLVDIVGSLTVHFVT